MMITLLLLGMSTTPTSKNKKSAPEKTQKQHEQVGNNVVIIVTATYSSSCMACQPCQQAKTRSLHLKKHKNSMSKLATMLSSLSPPLTLLLAWHVDHANKQKQEVCT